MSPLCNGATLYSLRMLCNQCKLMASWWRVISACVHLRLPTGQGQVGSSRTQQGEIGGCQASYNQAEPCVQCKHKDSHCELKHLVSYGAEMTYFHAYQSSLSIPVSTAASCAKSLAMLQLVFPVFAFIHFWVINAATCLSLASQANFTHHNGKSLSIPMAKQEGMHPTCTTHLNLSCFAVNPSPKPRLPGVWYSGYDKCGACHPEPNTSLPKSCVAMGCLLSVRYETSC